MLKPPGIFNSMSLSIPRLMQYLSSLRAVLLAVLVAASTGQFVQAQPTQRTWSSGATSGSWATSANWSGGTAPSSGNSINFTNNAQTTMTNDLASTNRYTGLYMRSNATSDRTLVGSFNMFGEFGGTASKIEVSSGTFRTLTVSGNVSLNGNTNLAYEINPVGGSIILGSISSLQTNRTLNLWGNDTENDLVRSVIVSNGITGADGGRLRVRQYANLILMGTSTYTGNSEIDAGTLMLGQGGIDGTLSDSSAIYIGNGGLTNLNATLRLGKTNGGQVLGGAGLLQINSNTNGGRRAIQSDNTSGTNTIARAINQNAQLFITNAAGGTLKFEGSFTTTNAPSSIVIQSGVTNAVVEFAAANSFSNVFLDHGQARFSASNSWGAGRIAMGMNAASTNASAVAFTTGMTVNAAIEARTNAGEKTILYTAGAGTLTMAGNITNNATGTARGLGMDVAGGGTMQVNGQISGDGAVTKEGFGRLHVAGENSYTGGTVINQGTLEISGTSALGSGEVTVNAGGTLAGNGSVAGNTTVHGTVAPGSSPGLLDFEGDLTFTANSVLSLEISSTGARGVNFDAIDVGGTLTIDPTATLVLTYIDGYSPQVGNTFQFLNFSVVDGEFLFNTDIGGGLSWDTSNLYTTGEMTVIPEPSTWALLGMGAAVTFWFGRRRVLRSR